MRDRKCALRLLLPACAALLVLPGAADAQPAPTTQAAKPAQKANDWPKTIHLGETTFLIDAPLAESLEGTALKARGTAQVEGPDEGDSSFASVWYEADVEINRVRRVVTLVSVRVPRIQLAGATPAKQQRLATRLGDAMTRRQLKLKLDDVLADVKFAARRESAPPKLGTDPPRILFETEPAVLVVFDGEPRFKAVEGTKLERALNTPFLVLHDPGKNAFYLDGGTTWFRAPDAKGPWTKTDSPPAAAVQIAQRDLKDAGVADSEVKEASASADTRIPKILVATSPTELIVSDGPPNWAPEVEGALNSLSNSESDVFQTLPDRRIWVVLSGRWYSSGAWGGPWTFVSPDQVPGSFRRISSDSAHADVLTFVPGTAPSREALRDANAPRTAAIRRSDAHVSVTYDGDPRFEAIPGTHTEYALNTPQNVLRIRGRYFVCDQGVWFSGVSPAGPWTVADSIPDEEIQSIPPESPVYNTRFATVYDSTPDTVYVAYTPAYLGSYPYYGTVVFGTGWGYRPWWGGFYYPRPFTWGFHARYAPWAGWGYGFGWGPAWGGFRYGFGFGWGARFCGPGGFFRPAFRNVNVTRNVTFNRNVTVNRNLYGARANGVHANGVHAEHAAAMHRADARGTGGHGTTGKTSAVSPKGTTSGKAAAPKSNAAKAHPEGHSGGGHHEGGGKKKER